MCAATCVADRGEGGGGGGRAGHAAGAVAAEGRLPQPAVRPAGLLPGRRAARHAQHLAGGQSRSRDAPFLYCFIVIFQSTPNNYCNFISCYVTPFLYSMRCIPFYEQNLYGYGAL